MVYALLAWLFRSCRSSAAPTTPAIRRSSTSRSRGGQCSGVVVAPRVVVTAAHCIAPGAGTVDVGATRRSSARLGRSLLRRPAIDHDLAALRLDRDADVTPIAIAAPLLGAVRLVGFGATAPNGPRGTRHAVETQIIEVDPRRARAGGAGDDDVHRRLRRRRDRSTTARSSA